MSALLSSPTPSFPSSSIPLHTPDEPPQTFKLKQTPSRSTTAPPAAASSSGSDGGGGVPPLVADLSSSPNSYSSSSAPNSEPSTPTSVNHSHSGVVPMYPYNVAMIPQNLSGGPMPDDSGITTRLPSICVDYLSHDWAEDDVWTSWKAMTKHKSEIANGVRLENASWRTWAKQRGNLKTISPETLNWLKDSDVTWLYGPLHTNIDAVPPPKQSTMSDRLGLEPLRSLSDSKKVAEKGGKKSKKPEIKTKPILKYRSLSDILMPSATTSPTMEDELNFDDQSTISVHHARSDSHLVRLNSLNRKKKRGSPITSPRSESPARAETSDSSSSVAGGRKEHRHISFNHRVEQCIAVDSTEEARRYITQQGRQNADSDDDEEGSDDEQVLTFKSSPRVATFGPSALSNTNDWEPHTIARLGPTTLKSVEQWPAPSPAVVYQNYPPSASMGGQDGRYDVPTYSAQPPHQSSSENTVVQQSASSARRQPYSYNPNAASMRAGWDPEDEDDYGMGYDLYSGGPDVGVGDEYDTAQYGSTHLVGGTHNNFEAGAPSYLGTGPAYNPYGGSVPSSTDSSPNHSRRSSNNSSGGASPSSYGSPNATPTNVRGPHAPVASKDATTPKRSILKGAAPAPDPVAAAAGNGRSRESSVESNFSTASSSSSTSPRFGTSPASSNSNIGILVDPSNTSPLHSPSISSQSSSSPSASPYGSANSLSSVMATAIPPHVRPTIGNRKSSSDDGAPREGRGRSASRGSSSSLERAASADRRSSSSISPSSYSPPSPSLGAGAGTSPSSTGITIPGARPVAIQTSRRVGSHDSLASAAHTIATGSSAVARTQPIAVVEASSESETETLTGEDEEPAAPKAVNGTRSTKARSLGGAEVEQVEDVSTVRATISDSDDSAPSSTATTPKAERKEPSFTASAPPAASGVNKTRPVPVSVAPAGSVPNGPVSPPLIPAPAGSTARTPGAPRFRQPSPSHATTSETAVVDNSSPAVASLSNSPQLDPADIASPQWADETAPSYARRSLLRAARGSSTGSAGSNTLVKTSSRDSHASIGSAGGPSTGRASVETDHQDYTFGFGLGGEDEGANDGLVGRTLEVAGTATRDLFGALRTSLFGRRS